MWSAGALCATGYGFGLFVAGVAFGQEGERLSLRHLSLLSGSARRSDVWEWGVQRLAYLPRWDYTNRVHGPSTVKKQDERLDDAEGKMAVES